MQQKQSPRQQKFNIIEATTLLNIDLSKFVEIIALIQLMEIKQLGINDKSDKNWNFILKAKKVIHKFLSISTSPLLTTPTLVW